MSEVKWIKLDKDIFHNRKIRQIEKMPEGDALIVIWLKILTLAGDVNDGGLVYFTKDIPYTDELLANEFGRPTAIIKYALQTFSRFGMIEIIDNILKVSNWEKYQNVDGLERIKEQNRIRKQNQRAREKQALLTEEVSRDTSRDVTQQNKKEDIDIERDIDNGAKRTSRKFTPPTYEEVKAYCQERNNGIDPQRFIDYYQARGWVLSNGRKVQDWKACCRTWEKNNKPADSGDNETFRNAIKRMHGGEA